MNLKRHVVRKNGKEHVYYSLSETIRINKNRTVQRRVLNLGELNTTQTEQWQRSIEVIEAEGPKSATSAIYRSRRSGSGRCRRCLRSAFIKFVGSRAAGVWRLLVRQSAVARIGAGRVF